MRVATYYPDCIRRLRFKHSVKMSEGSPVPYPSLLRETGITVESIAELKPAWIQRIYKPLHAARVDLRVVVTSIVHTSVAAKLYKQ